MQCQFTLGQLNLAWWRIQPYSKNTINTMKNFCIVFLLLFSMNVEASINCNIGSDVKDALLGVLGKTDGAETSYNLATGLGLISNNMIIDRAIDIKKNSTETLNTLSKLRSYCAAFESKDVVTQYFAALNLVFGSTPMSPLIKEYVKMGTFIVNRSNAIAEGTVAGALGNEGYSLILSVSVSDYRWYWNKQIVGQVLKDQNHIISTRILSKIKVLSGAEPSVYIVAPTLKAYPLKIDLGGEGVLKDLGVDLTNNFAFVEITWKTGQISMVPIASGYYKSSNLNLTFPFVLREGVYALDL